MHAGKHTTKTQKQCTNRYLTAETTTYLKPRNQKGTHIYLITDTNAYIGTNGYLETNISTGIIGGTTQPVTISR